MSVQSVLRFSLALLGLMCFLSLFFESNNPQIIILASLIAFIGVCRLHALFSTKLINFFIAPVDVSILSV